MKGAGRAVFVAILLLIAGVLNFIYGIAAVGNAHFFDNTQYVFSSLHTWGWITIIVGIIQLSAGFSLFAGGTYGRVIGIVAATIGALESLLSIGGTHPWWSLAIFALCIYILHGLVRVRRRDTCRSLVAACNRESGRWRGSRLSPKILNPQTPHRWSGWTAVSGRPSRQGSG